MIWSSTSRARLRVGLGAPCAVRPLRPLRRPPRPRPARSAGVGEVGPARAARRRVPAAAERGPAGNADEFVVAGARTHVRFLYLLAFLFLFDHMVLTRPILIASSSEPDKISARGPARACRPPFCQPLLMSPIARSSRLAGRWPAPYQTSRCPGRCLTAGWARRRHRCCIAAAPDRDHSDRAPRRARRR